MKKVDSFHYFDLRLKAPSDEALQKGLAKFEEDAFDAAEYFNTRFRGIKQIVVFEVGDQTLSLMLVFYSETPEKVTAKELTVFSRYLQNEMNWNRFSRESSKLFIPNRIVETTAHEAFTTFEEFGREYDEDQILRWPSLIPDWADPGYFLADDQDFDIELTDEQMLAVLTSIIQTQNLGLEESKAAKQKAINEIKTIITPWAV